MQIVIHRTILEAAEQGQNTKTRIRKRELGTSLVVQWLRLHTPNAGGQGSIPSEGTRSHMPQLNMRMPQLDPTCHKKDPVSCN